jgi:hypothetical protein
MFVFCALSLHYHSTDNTVNKLPDQLSLLKISPEADTYQLTGATDYDKSNLNIELLRLA